MTSVGYIGLGNMGGPMAVRLGEAGLSPLVYGRNKDRLKPALAAGARECASPTELAARAEIVILCVTDTRAVDDVVFGADGIAAGARPSSLIVDMSTIAPDATVDMAKRLEAMVGARWIDAPVSGGTAGAAAGTLSVFLGGAEADIDRLRPVLAHLGRNVTRMGPVGAGQTTKLVNQIMVACSVAMLAEAVGLAEKAGIDAAALPAALAGGRADSNALQHYWPRLVARDYTPLANLTSIVKDLDLIQALGRRCGATLPLTGLVREYNQLLINEGRAGEDLTALARLYGAGTRREP